MYGPKPMAFRLSHYPAMAVAEGMGIGRSVVFDIESREERGGVTLATMSRMAGAMGCQLVYGIVPLDGLTMEALWEKRLWAGLLGVPMLNITEREEIVSVQEGTGAKEPVS